MYGILLASMLSALPADKPFTASDLVTACKVLRHDAPYSESPQMNWCLGYISGVTDTIQTTESLLEPKTLKPMHAQHLCLPNNVEIKELGLVFLKFMDNNPEQLHYSASSAVNNALMRSYNCKVPH